MSRIHVAYPHVRTDLDSLTYYTRRVEAYTELKGSDSERERAREVDRRGGKRGRETEGTSDTSGKRKAGRGNLRFERPLGRVVNSIYLCE